MGPRCRRRWIEARGTREIRQPSWLRSPLANLSRFLWSKERASAIFLFFFSRYSFPFFSFPLLALCRSDTSFSPRPRWLFFPPSLPCLIHIERLSRMTPTSWKTTTTSPGEQRAIVVHSSYPMPPSPLFPPLPLWDSLPIDVLHIVAGHLDSARDLCSFEAVCRSTR